MIDENSRPPITVGTDGPAITLWLERPDRGNALSAAMVAGLEAALDAALAGGARLIILRGRGKNFCTGFDLADLEATSDAELALRVIRIELLLQRIHALSVPTLAVAQGRVFGAGADLVAVCDHRLALRGASFAFPGPAFGLVLGTGRLAGLIGDGPARRLLVAGATIEAQTALGLGLATEVLDEEQLADRIGEARAAATRLDAPTIAALHGRTRRADDAGDLAALTRSVARPGLRQRIQDYRAAVIGARKPEGGMR